MLFDKNFSGGIDEKSINHIMLRMTLYMVHTKD